MHVTIHTAALTNDDVSISNAAAEAVRMSFNPSKVPAVDRLKALAAAFLSACDEVAGAPNASGRPVGRECAVAKTHIETAAMWAVKAATS